MKVLHLTLKKKWFDMIASGEKKAEYRELKHYWTVRLGHKYYSEIETGYYEHSFTEFDIVRFKNGYAKDAPTMDVKLESIDINPGRQDWGAEPGISYFRLELGEIISITNYRP